MFCCRSCSCTAKSRGADCIKEIRPYTDLTNPLPLLYQLPWSPSSLFTRLQWWSRRDLVTWVYIFFGFFLIISCWNPQRNIHKMNLNDLMWICLDDFPADSWLDSLQNYLHQIWPVWTGPKYSNVYGRNELRFI